MRLPVEGYRSLSVPAALYARLEELKEKNGGSISSIACEAVKWFMEEYVFD